MQSEALAAVARVVSPQNRLAMLKAAGSIGKPAPNHWREWCRTLFPRAFTSPFADRHITFWEWIEAIEADTKPTVSAFIDVEPRGGGKTTTAETAVIRLGAKRTRQFVLYVRGTQDKANESIQNIGAKLESNTVETYHPELSERSISKYGHSRGWRVDMLRCSTGYNVVGLGLDAAVRGVKLDDYRPDLIVFDDIDHEHDTPKTIQKKIDIITKAILPAGAGHCAYAVVQNLIHESGIVASIVDGTADFLHDRILSGPHVAVEGLTYESRAEGGYRITGGVATWEGQSLETCERQINEWGLSAFLREAQQEVETSGGLWDHVEFRHIEYDNLPPIERGAVWVDPAVTSTEESDSMAIAAGGVAENEAGIKHLFVFYSWEQITSPEDVIRRAILTAVRYGFETVGVETDQGGDTWQTVYNSVCEQLLKSPEYPDIAITYDENGNPIPYRFPQFRQAKAGAGHGSKVHRNGHMLVDYEHGKVYHVIGTHTTVEKSLRRFPKKPLDLADALYWLWNDLMRHGKPGRLPEQPTNKSRWQENSNAGGRWKI